MIEFNFDDYKKYTHLFRPSLAKVLSVLMYKWLSNDKKPFYLPIRPSKSDTYQVGDSLIELTQMKPAHINFEIRNLKRLGIIDFKYEMHNLIKPRHFIINENILNSIKSMRGL